MFAVKYNTKYSARHLSQLKIITDSNEMEFIRNQNANQAKMTRNQKKKCSESTNDSTLEYTHETKKSNGEKRQTYSAE